MDQRYRRGQKSNGPVSWAYRFDACKVALDVRKIEIHPRGAGLVSKRFLFADVEPIDPDNPAKIFQKHPMRGTNGGVR